MVGDRVQQLRRRLSTGSVCVRKCGAVAPSRTGACHGQTRCHPFPAQAPREANGGAEGRVSHGLQASSNISIAVTTKDVFATSIGQERRGSVRNRCTPCHRRGRNVRQRQCQHLHQECPQRQWCSRQRLNRSRRRHRRQLVCQNRPRHPQCSRDPREAQRRPQRRRLFRWNQQHQRRCQKIQYPNEVEVRVRSHGETGCRDQQKPKTKIKMKSAKKYRAIYRMNCLIGKRNSERIWSMKILQQTPGETQSKEVKTLPSHLRNFQWRLEQKVEPGSGSVHTHFPKDPFAISA